MKLQSGDKPAIKKGDKLCQEEMEPGRMVKAQERAEEWDAVGDKAPSDQQVSRVKARVPAPEGAKARVPALEWAKVADAVLEEGKEKNRNEDPCKKGE